MWVRTMSLIQYWRWVQQADAQAKTILQKKRSTKTSRIQPTYFVNRVLLRVIDRAVSDHNTDDLLQNG